MNLIHVFMTLTALIFATPGFADPIGSKSSFGGGGSIKGGRTALIQQHIENKAASSNTLTWPNFPRIWMERSSTRSSSESGSAGVQVSSSGLGLIMGFSMPGLGYHNKRTIEVRYNVVTSAIFIASTGEPDGQSSTSESANEEMFLEAREGTSLVFPKVSKERPMVGLCYFEMTLNTEHLRQQGVDLLGAGAQWANGASETAKISRFSSFFQIESNTPIETYYFETCANRFRDEVEKSAQKNFELFVRQITENNCAPAHEGHINPDGDFSCDFWFRKFPTVLQKVHVPRCEQNSQGQYRCVLKAKEGVRCPLFANKSTGEYSDKFDFKNFNTKVSAGSEAFGCDTQRNQRCEFESEPWMVFGAPLAKGTARCKQH